MKRKPIVLKSQQIINAFLFVVFLLFAVVQLNDPDPLLWFIIYLSVAVLSLMSNYIVISKWIIGLYALVLLLYSRVYFSSLLQWLQIEEKAELFGEMVYEKPYLEGTREFMGLFIAVLALGYQLKKRQSNHV